jgi:hypothetical protein
MARLFDVPAGPLAPAGYLTPQERVALEQAPRMPAGLSAWQGPAAGGAEGATTYAGENGLRTDQVRRAYVQQTQALDRGDVEARTSLKQAMRRVTPAPQRAWLDFTRPDLGPRAGSVAGAARTNAAATARALQFARLGRASLVGSALLGGVEIATAKDKPRAAVAVGGGMGGGVAGGIAGGEGGALIGSVVPGPGTAIGAIIGGIGGSIAGGALGHEGGARLYDRLRRRGQ